MELHATKNVGKEHAKWSPVGKLLLLFFPPVVTANRGMVDLSCSYRVVPATPTYYLEP
jgi:hypothetical protein